MFFALQQIGRDLWSQKLRTLLTVFGIAWGTVAVSLLLAFGSSFHGHMAKSFVGLGENIVICWPSRTSITWDGLPKGRAIRLTEEDMRMVREQAGPALGMISGEIEDSLLANHAEKVRRVSVSGVAPEFGVMRNLIADAGGRWLNAPDANERRRVAFVGDKLAEDLFGTRAAVGRTFLLNGSPFVVVGVLRPKQQDSSYSGRDEGKMFVPFSTFTTLTGARYVDNFIVKAAAGASSEPLKKGVVAALARRHRFSPEDKEAVAMWDTTDNLKFLDTFMGGFRTFLAIVGMMTLVVGGIGVSNIMNVVVEERTREIGIKMALGAPPASIRRQFLLETLCITFLGGLAGIVIAAGICAAFPASFDEYVGSPRISPVLAFLVSGVLGLIGLVAGYFPARSASRLDPVVAMKV